MIKEFWTGFSYWYVGWKAILSNKTLLVYTVAPFLIAIAFFGFTVWWLFNHLSGWTSFILLNLLSVSASWVHTFYYPFYIGLAAVFLIAAVYLAYVVQMILGGPFYSLLAVHVCKMRHLPVPKTGGWGFQSFVVRPALLLCLGFLLFVFSFVPLLNILSLVGTFLVLAFDTLEYTFDAFDWSFSRRLRYTFSRPWRWAGMAASLALTMLLPGSTLLVLPGAIVGAALIFEKRKVNP